MLNNMTPEQFLKLLNAIQELIHELEKTEAINWEKIYPTRLVLWEIAEEIKTGGAYKKIKEVKKE